MAKKAQKDLARQNAATLKSTHLTTLSIHMVFIFLRLFLLRHYFWHLTLSRNSIIEYGILSAPGAALEVYMEKAGRPRYSADGKVLIRTGDDLSTGGLMEYMWDVIYWTWINLMLVALLGDWAWWLYLVVPGFGVYLLISLFLRMRSGAGLMAN